MSKIKAQSGVFSSSKEPKRGLGSYRAFSEIDGRHPLKDVVPSSAVEYEVRQRPQGKVAYFNFDLSKEMGLLSEDHPNELNSKLKRALIDAFSIVIINEYDQKVSKKKIPKSEIKPNKYMATRYLQLQHPSRTGKTSGDGRGIWNGTFTHRGVTWDISSCGTGATKLCPAAVLEGRPIKTGDNCVSYGSGYSHLSEGLSSALMSEIVHQNGITTERVLAIIEYPNGSSLTVRAAPNLLRPSHFFVHLKQGNLLSLKKIVDYFIRRQSANGEWRGVPEGKARYDYFAKKMAETFAKAVARFESEYLFVWMAWDGDNVLANGGIIDYGSVRQFGLNHHRYRFDDVERWSSNLDEQKKEAKYIVQTLIQAAEFLKTSKKAPIQSFSKNKILKEFDQTYSYWRKAYFLERLGYSKEDSKLLLLKKPGLVTRLFNLFQYFEKSKDGYGYRKVADGVNWSAIYCVRSLARELPRHFSRDCRPLPAKEFLKLMKTAYTPKRALKATSGQEAKIKALQKAYVSLARSLADLRPGASAEQIRRIFLEIGMRSSVINAPNRVTGDAVVSLAERLVREKKGLSRSEFQQVVMELISLQNFTPQKRQKKGEPKALSSRAKALLKALQEIIWEYREGL